MFLICVVCKDYPRIKDPQRRFHCFPKDEEMRFTWLKALNIEHVKKNYGVCSYHFSPSDYRFGPIRKRLSVRAVPNSALMSMIGKKSCSDHEYCMMTGSVQPLSDHAYCVMVKNADKFEPVKPLINDNACVDITNGNKSESVKPLNTVNNKAYKSRSFEPLLTPVKDHAYCRIKSEPIETMVIDDCDYCENTLNSIQSEPIKPLRTNDHAYFQITKIESLAGVAKPLGTKKAYRPRPVKPLHTSSNNPTHSRTTEKANKRPIERIITMNASKPGPMKPLVIPINKHAYCVITKNDKKAGSFEPSSSLLDTPIEEPAYSKITEEAKKSRPEPLINLNPSKPDPGNPINTPKNDPTYSRITENAKKSAVKPMIIFNANKPGSVKSIIIPNNDPESRLTENVNESVEPLVPGSGNGEEQLKSGPTVKFHQLQHSCRTLNGLSKLDFKTEEGWKRYRKNYLKMKSLHSSAKRSITKFKHYKRKLTALVKILEKKNDTEAASYLEGLPVLLKQMLLRGRQKVGPTTKKYPEEIKNFALRLYLISTRSYEFVRSKLPDFLPSVSRVQDWNAQTPKLKDSTQEVIDAVASISYDLPSEELVQSERMGDVAQLLLSFEQPEFATCCNQ